MRKGIRRATLNRVGKHKTYRIKLRLLPPAFFFRFSHLPRFAGCSCVTGCGARPAVEPPIPGDQAQQNTRRRKNDVARGPHVSRSRGRGEAAAPRVVFAVAERGEGVSFYGRRYAGVCLGLFFGCAAVSREPATAC